MATSTLRMRDVCARTGLARSTIHHYIREGLLPRPNKTGRNTATYDDAFVARAQLVRTLQEKTHMPLSQIRRTLEQMPRGSEASIDLERFSDVTHSIANDLRLASERALSRSELLDATGLKPVELDGLKAVGLIEPENGTYSPLDVRIAMAVARIRNAGATAERGFAGSPEIVAAYKKNLKTIARTEAREMVRMMGSIAAIEHDGFVASTADALADLVAAIHRKALVNAIGEINNGGSHGNARR